MGNRREIKIEYCPRSQGKKVFQERVSGVLNGADGEMIKLEDNH